MDWMRKSKVTRFVWLIVSVILNALGTAMITVTALGIAFAPSIGTFTLAISVVQLLIQAALLRRDFPPVQILQMVPAVVLSYFIDAFLAVFGPVPLDAYWAKLLMLLAGCVVQGFSIALEVYVDVLYLPLDGMNKAIAQVSGRDFDVVKTIVDCVMVAAAAVLSFALMGRLEGVREGTVIAAVICGLIVRFFSLTVFKDKTSA